jgi:hypothetical protein
MLAAAPAGRGAAQPAIQVPLERTADQRRVLPVPVPSQAPCEP